MRPLIDLIRAVPEPLEFPENAASLMIADITADSRHVKPGGLFAAVKGSRIDGTTFIHDARKAGAVAVLADQSSRFEAEGLAVVRAPNPRRALALMAAALFGRQPAHIVAITGTDGKTSTADFCRQFWHHMGHNSASIGTLGVRARDGSQLFPGSHTTPDPVELHLLLAGLADKQVTHLAMEASSHGLDQWRLDGVKLQAGAFTNLGRDHFDYHKDEAHYFAAKTRLFSELLPKGATAVLNQDDARFSELRKICDARGIRVIGFGHKGAQYKIEAIEPHPAGQKARVVLDGNPYTLDIPLAGGFQVMNILAALGLVVATGGDMEKALAVVPRFTGVPGRIEQVATLKNGASVFVDYAHTPLALANILRTLRPHTKGKLHVVFGCGGDRDPGKRPQMGEAAAKLADVVIVTDDNPRSEDPAKIRAAVLAACPGGKEVADRKAAIYGAMKGLGRGDVLVIAGKGHETTQTIGREVFPFNDAEVAREAAKEL